MPKPKFKPDILFLFRMIDDELRKQMTQQMKEIGITPSQSAFLLQFDFVKTTDLPLKTIEKNIHVSQATVAGLSYRLEEKGFITMATSESDRRSKIVHITEKGIKINQQVKENMKKARTQALKGLTETEQDILQALLTKTFDSITNKASNK